VPLPSIHPVTKSSEQIRRTITRLINFEEYKTDEGLRAAVSHLRAAHDALPKDFIDKEL
jgi:hypothetical protein